VVFSSVIFLFGFLPVVLVLYFLGGRAAWNPVLLLASLFFYAWGETVYVALMLFSIGANYLFGLLIDRSAGDPRAHKRYLALGIAINLLPLSFFKYANFFVDNLNQLLALGDLSPIELDPIHLPIGISFFTFQAMSYIIDVYRREARVQHNPVNLALYIALFPQLIAGPIVRYHDIAGQLSERTTRLEDFYTGVVRFIVGLGKKVLIANVMGRMADSVFELPPEHLSTQLAWLAIVAYTLQIYFDFSGYSDMAIGLGRMFGFRFLENFNYPYISRSIQEFWRRWHISLSSWFRDYLYIPLGGNRRGTVRTYLHLLIVFFLVGLWHGASWNFVIWGLFHGAFLVLERTALGSWLGAAPAPLRHAYVLLVVMVSWVFFRSESLDYALQFLGVMFSLRTEPYMDVFVFSAINNEFFVALGIGIVGATPVMRCANHWIETHGTSLAWLRSIELAKTVCLIGILLYSTANLLGGAHNPFLYFRF
jgi:alginate O-acetyltransferase complex protein AlgI